MDRGNHRHWPVEAVVGSKQHTFLGQLTGYLPVRRPYLIYFLVRFDSTPNHESGKVVDE
jgi:hypothetical protein